MKKLLITVIFLCMLCGCSKDNTPADDPHRELLRIYESCAQVRSDKSAYLTELASMDLCAGDKSRDYDMVNTAILEAFLKGEANSASFIMLCYDGGFEHITLTKDSIHTSRVAEVNGEAAITWETEYELAHMEYTDKGWLILTRIMPDNPQGGNHDGWVEPTLIYKLTPTEEVLRSACKKYIEPIGYGAAGFFLSDWNGDDMSKLDFAGLFPAAYSIHYGRNLIYYESPYPVDESSTVAWVDAEEFESIMLPLFDLSPEELRELADFDGEKYRVALQRTPDELMAITGSDAAAAFFDVIPEVVSLTENPDGTLTLTVDGICAAKATDRLFTHYLTLRDEGHRVVYLENRVTKK